MDSRVKRIVILLASLTVLAVLMIVVAANRRNMERMAAAPSSSSETAASVSVISPFKTDPNAWRSDESFFDSEDPTLTGRILENMKTLVVYAVSVERDLRVRILDYEGNLAAGNAFELELKPAGIGAPKTVSVTDEDKDGLVELTDLEPGNYEVTLKPITGFNVPDRPLKVKVRDKLEYSLIEDIFLDIRHETDRDREKEDLMEISAFDFAGATQKTAPEKDMVVGIDISSRDGEVDFVKLYDAGIRFVMVRAGYRGADSGEIIADDMFSANARNAIRAGLDVGAYFFSQAVSEREAVEEASALLTMCSGATITYPLCIREDRAGGQGRGDEIDEKRRTDQADAFCRTVKSEGYEPMVYGSGSWLETNLEAGRLEKYKIWLGDFSQAPRYEGFYDLWQYTGSGTVPGIDHKVGLTISYMKESE